MKFKSFSLLLVFVLIVMSLVGCNATNNNDNSPQEIARVKAAAMIADEKLPLVFVPYTPEGSDTAYMIGKDNFTTMDSVKNFLKSYYSDNMINSMVEKTIKVQDVPGKGSIVTLNLPEDYPTVTGHKFTEQDTISIHGNKATLAFTTDNGQKVTYTLVKENDKWLVDSKNF